VEDSTKGSARPASFNTKDWIEASILLAHRMPLAAVAEQRGVVWFSFLFPDKATALIDQYILGTLEVNIREFVDSQRRVKDLCHRTRLPRVESVQRTRPDLR
jgi:hypothetical protein